MFPYIGGKKVHAKWIDPLFPVGFDTYVEPFGGAFWMYWMSKNTPVKTNVYNDFNRHLVNVYECSRTDPQRYQQELLNLYPDVANSSKFDQFRDDVFKVFHTQFVIPDYSLAAKYMFLQLHLFSGGIGLHEKSKIYVAKGYKPKFHTYTEKFEQDRYVNRLAKLSATENMDCRDVIRKYDSPTTFFYVDPPYFNMEDYYTKNSFGYDDHIELLNLLKTISGKFALSYYYFKELENIMPRDKFYWHEQETISTNGLSKAENATTKDGKPAAGIRTKRVEVLILNYQPTKNSIILPNSHLFEVV